MPGGGRHYGSHRPLIDLLFYWDTHTHTNYLSIIDTHTHTYMQASTHTHTRTSSPILISHSSSHRGLTDDSPRRAGGGAGGAVGGFWDGRGFRGIPPALIGRRASWRGVRRRRRCTYMCTKPVRTLLERVRNPDLCTCGGAADADEAAMRAG